MTFKEKLKQEHPEYVNDKYAGGCRGCPYNYGYIKEEELNCFGGCILCWNKDFNNVNHISTKTKL